MPLPLLVPLTTIVFGVALSEFYKASKKRNSARVEVAD